MLQKKIAQYQTKVYEVKSVVLFSVLPFLVSKDLYMQMHINVSLPYYNGLEGK